MCPTALAFSQPTNFRCFSPSSVITVATYRQLRKNAPNFTDVVATPNCLYTFAIKDQPPGYRAHCFSLSYLRFNQHCMFKDETKKKKKAQKPTAQKHITADSTYFDEHKDGDDDKKGEKRWKIEGQGSNQRRSLRRSLFRKKENEADSAKKGRETTA